MDRQAFEYASSLWTNQSIREAVSSGSSDRRTQQLYYSGLGDHIAQNIPDGPFAALGHAVKLRREHVSDVFAAAMTGNTSFVDTLPALSPIVSSDDWERQYPPGSSAASRYVTMGIAYLAETSAFGDAEKVEFETPTIFIASEIASYWAWKADSTTKNSSMEQLAAIITQTRADLSQIEVKAQELENKNLASRLQAEQVLSDFVSNFERKAEYLEKRHLDLGTNIVSQEQALKENRAFAQIIDNNIAAFSAAIREELKINTAKRLWDARSIANQRAFTMSALVVAMLILVPIILVYIFRNEVISYLHVLETPVVNFGPATTGLTNGGASGPHLSPASLTVITIGRLLTVTIPIALWFWLIKLVVRYNYRSMILADDARQRSTMMDTYFHLIEQQAASVEDRALILAALFRPAPGHGPESVEPPDFTDFINKMKS